MLSVSLTDPGNTNVTNTRFLPDATKKAHPTSNLLNLLKKVIWETQLDGFGHTMLHSVLSLQPELEGQVQALEMCMFRNKEAEAQGQNH